MDCLLSFVKTIEVTSSECPERVARHSLFIQSHALIFLSFPQVIRVYSFLSLSYIMMISRIALACMLGMVSIWTPSSNDRIATPFLKQLLMNISDASSVWSIINLIVSSLSAGLSSMSRSCSWTSYLVMTFQTIIFSLGLLSYMPYKKCLLTEIFKSLISPLPSFWSSSQTPDS